MIARFALGLASAVVFAPSALAQNVDLEEETLVVGAGETVPVMINDQWVQFRIAPDAVSVPTVNADTATRLGLAPSMIGYAYRIGPVTIRFRTDTVGYALNGGTFRRRTAFSDRRSVEGADGIAGPGAFPQRRVVLSLRDPLPEDRALTFAMDGDMGRSQTGVLLEVGGRPIHAAFSFSRGGSLVSATGGRWIADAHGGHFSGEAREVPILYGVARPARPLATATPLMLGELEVRNIAVRTADMGNADDIGDAAPPDADPSEIVVTADTGRDVPPQRIYIGMDTIGHCASITYDFEAETVTLMCPPQPQAAAG